MSEKKKKGIATEPVKIRGIYLDMARAAVAKIHKGRTYGRLATFIEDAIEAAAAPVLAKKAKVEK